MRIYLVRHGESVAEGSDNDRPLSQKGESDIQRLASFIFPLKIQVSKIIQSEKFRARQTANILSSSIQAKSIETCSELDPLESPDIIMRQLYVDKQDALLVGHMPFMGKLVGQLIMRNSDTNIVFFKAGSMVCLEQVQTQQWVISWMLSPELFIVK